MADGGRLVGRWRSANGTAGVLFGDEVVFAADGTGELRHHSALHGEETLAFRWRMEGEAVLRLRLIDDEEDEDEDDLVGVEFRAHESDAGRHVVLAEAGRDGFWLCLDPLERVED
ncbi:hypothetical protein ACIBG7_41805 [Nonomuraea sp. NPDC050328]|uniref:hypothetical protein n=1 Tax=Nonomuraea sp. NPDC050328 TaxID=3364361 RepID=UPI00379C1A6F